MRRLPPCRSRRNPRGRSCRGPRALVFALAAPEQGARGFRGKQPRSGGSPRRNSVTATGGPPRRRAWRRSRRREPSAVRPRLRFEWLRRLCPEAPRRSSGSRLREPPARPAAWSRRRDTEPLGRRRGPDRRWRRRPAVRRGTPQRGAERAWSPSRRAARLRWALRGCDGPPARETSARRGRTSRCGHRPFPADPAPAPGPCRGWCPAPGPCGS
jgi:hypothetical protein